MRIQALYLPCKAILCLDTIKSMLYHFGKVYRLSMRSYNRLSSAGMHINFGAGKSGSAHENIFLAEIFTPKNFLAKFLRLWKIFEKVLVREI